MHRIACFTLVAALFLASGCGLFGESKQTPFTAEELDRLLSHSSLLHETEQEAKHSYTGINIRERDKIVLKAKNDMIEKLGWDLHRYYYIKKNCNAMVGLHSRRRGINSIERDIREADSNDKRQQLIKLLEHKRKELSALIAEIETSMTVIERVLIDERLPIIRKQYEEYTPHFNWNEG